MCNGRSGGLVIGVRAIYSDDTSSNATGYFNFLFEKTKINEKEAVVGPPLKSTFKFLTNMIPYINFQGLEQEHSLTGLFSFHQATD